MQSSKKNTHAALVTGSSQGIGLEIASALASEGTKICLHSLHDDASAQSAVDRLEQETGKRPALVTGDLATPGIDGIESVFRSAVESCPEIDLLVNNAGTYIDVPFLDLPYEVFDKTMHLNVYAGFFLTQRFARYWVERGIPGRVLLVGSINGRLAEPDHAAYDTSKGAVEMMVKTLCVALAPHGIRVNGLAPGLFVTPLTERALADDRLMDWMKLHTPNGKVPGPEACGAAARFLLGDDAWHVTGQMLLVDGGMSAWQQPDPPPQSGTRSERPISG